MCPRPRRRTRILHHTLLRRFRPEQLPVLGIEIKLPILSVGDGPRVGGQPFGDKVLFTDLEIDFWLGGTPVGVFIEEKGVEEGELFADLIWFVVELPFLFAVDFEPFFFGLDVFEAL